MNPPLFEFDDRPPGVRLLAALREVGRHRRVVSAAAAAVLLCLVGAGVWQGPAKGVDLYRVRNGDTLEWTPGHCFLSKLGLACLTRRLRLFGVDAFETGQTCLDADGRPWRCGRVAAQRLRQIADEPGFSCNVDDEFADRDAREFARCSVKGRDVGALMVSEGLAFYYGRGVDYLPIEAKARAEKRGAWAGKFIRPQFWRQGARL
jgi:endonuclease YncB( thermonuclease family)